MQNLKKNGKFQRRQRWIHWPEHWNSLTISLIASFQLTMAMFILGMEIGNAVVDLYRANVYSGFWSFPFLLAAVLASYASVCMQKTPTKAMIAVVLQSIAIFVLLLSTGFLIAYMSTNFTLCIGSQCSQNSTSFAPDSNTSAYRYSAETYLLLKRIFIGFEFTFTILFLISSVVFIFIFMKSTTLLSDIYPIEISNNSSKVRGKPGDQLNSTSYSSFINSESSDNTSTVISTTLTSYYRAQKVCPKCEHVSPYIPEKNFVECPKCKYKSPFVEHAQQF